MAENAPNLLKKLAQFGQSPWYDNIDRRLIENGELKLLFDMGILGVTSNPTIFEKAVKGSSVYDAKIKRLKEEGKSVEEICDDLTADDVRDAADLLQGVYERTKGRDGYVSIEVLPQYARDPGKTVAYARHIFKKVGRKNIMVKVPGTKESEKAIRTLTAEGIPVNVTLLFSVSHYETAALSFTDGLRDRMRCGLDLPSVASVASVFISRIDTKVDSILDVFIKREADLSAREGIAAIKGKAAIANAKMIYQRFKELFNEAMFGDLKMAGAPLQRVLWASTSTKNDSYGDCLYVDNLIGPQTVNTMPHQTVVAFADHGRPALTLENDLESARTALAGLDRFNIDLGAVCEDAQKEGLVAFQNSFDSLLAAIKGKTA